jgi:tetratricopeptide (TPR) repeat protein
VRLRVFLSVLLASASTIACGAGTRGGATAVARAPCSADEYWDGTACKPRPDSRAALDRAIGALADFQVDTALTDLQQARAAGPHAYETLVTIYEQLGIAHAYLGNEAEALAAFDMLLILDPGHLLSYTLSPQATFVFERARAQHRASPTIDLDWPRDLEVDDAIPVDVEVLADPDSMLRRATLEVRTKGTASQRTFDVDLAAPGAFRRVVLPKLRASRPEVLQLWLRAYDGDGNEVLRWGSAETPREIALGYRAPTPWYRTWWVWAAAGSVVAIGTGTTVYLLQKEPSATLGGGLDIDR